MISRRGEKIKTHDLKTWINTTSNPRAARVHNCDSWLMIYYKTDPGAPWNNSAAIIFDR
jgi:hypothetical protein